MVRKLDYVRDVDIVDAELRLISAVRWSIRQQGGRVSSAVIDRLLDERNQLTHPREDTQ